MTCRNPEISDQIVAWVDGALGGDEAARFAAHVASCEDCKRDAESVRSLSGRIGRAYEVQRVTPLSSICPSPDELVDFAAATTPPNRATVIETHLASCAWCNEQVETLREIDEAPLAETERGEAPPMPVALRDAFRSSLGSRAALSAPRAGAAIALPAAHRGGGGWGTRRILAAVATLTVLIGMSSLFVFRPDMFGAHPVGSDVVSAARPSMAAPSPPAGSALADTKVTVASGAGAVPQAAASGAGAVPQAAASARRVAQPDESNHSAASEEKEEASPPAASPALARAANPKGSAAARPAAGPASPAQTAGASTPPVAPPAAPPAPPAPAAPRPTQTRLADAAPVAAPKAEAPRPVVPPPAPAVQPKPSVPAPALAVPSAATGSGGDGTASARPRPAMKKADVASPPVSPEEGRRPSSAPMPKSASGHVTTDKVAVGRTEKDLPPYTESKGSVSEPADASVDLKSSKAAPRAPGAVARTSTSNVAAPPRSQVESPRRDDERQRYTQSADDTTRGGDGYTTSPNVAAGAAPAPAAGTVQQQTVTTSTNGPTLRGGSSGLSYASQVAYRARQTLFQLTGTHEFSVRVVVDPASASSAGQARRVRIEVTVPSGSSASVETVRRELVRAVPLNLERGDEVVVLTR